MNPCPGGLSESRELPICAACQIVANKYLTKKCQHGWHVWVGSWCSFGFGFGLWIGPIKHTKEKLFCTFVDDAAEKSASVKLLLFSHTLLPQLKAIKVSRK